MPEISTYNAWRLDLAERLQTGEGLLRAILATDGIQPQHVMRIDIAAGSLKAASADLRALRAQVGILALAELVVRLEQAVRRVRVVVVWRGVSTPSALEDLALVLDDLEEALREARIVGGFPSLGEEATVHA